MKRFLIGLFISFSVLFLGKSVSAETFIDAYFFWGTGCPHCAQEAELLEDLKKEYSNLRVHEFEILKNRRNALLLQKVGRKLEADVSSVPFLVIGDQYFTGYSQGVNSQLIKDRVKECSQIGCPDLIASLANPKEEEAEPEANPSEKEGSIMNLPIFGNINPEKISIPVLATLFGFLDGFNPCAMWVLLFLISMLLGMKDKKKMWTLGLAFIFSSALVYFVFMAAWLKLILFLGFMLWIRISIGGIALIGGVYSLKEAVTKKEVGCKVSNDNKRERTFEKIKEIIARNNFWLALGGIVLLAFMINLVELICSAGFPAVFTQVLALNNLPVWQYYMYILIYIFFFMLDDIVVFTIAMVTLHLTGITTKYVKYSRLIGGALMILVGILMILKPEYLMFG